MSNASQKLAQQYRQTFGSPAGEDVLHDLEMAFSHRALTGKDPHMTTVRAAQHDVVMYIQSMMEAKGDE